MNLYVADNSILNTFFAIGSWQALVSIVIFIGLQVGLWYFFKYIKLQFIYRILIGMAIGLVFGLIIQGIEGFPKNGLTDKFIPGSEHPSIPGDPTSPIIRDENPGYRLWAYQLNVWISLMKNIFINGILLLTAPVVFLAIFRVTSKPSAKRMGSITGKGLGLLLVNVLIAFMITFWLGYFLKTGEGIHLNPDTDFQKTGADTKPLPEIIWNYVPANMITPWLTVAVIPLMVIGALFGSSVKILSKRNAKDMDHIRHGADVAWKVIISMLMTFMKIMPLAVMSMIGSSIVAKPIGALGSIGKVLGVGYLALILCVGVITLEVMMFGIKVVPWWKSAFRVLIQGFATQSSNATLPTSIEVLEDDMKVNDRVVSVLAPLSTSMGLMGCAGVQAGLITSFLWTATIGDPNALDVHDMGLGAYFLLSLVITVVASLGIAGVPGTAGVVTAGVLGGLGLGRWFAPVYAIVGALDGLFDMGRTGVNVLGPQAVVPIVAKSEGLILPDSPLLNAKQLKHQEEIKVKIEKKELAKEAHQKEIKEKLATKKLEQEEKKKAKARNHDRRPPASKQ
ncbi:hypothetical protein JN01_0521 [Entomoplasma freundtii]|uniref:L-cystine uptake protein TcyP n=1 Tax=Entomoplasma freundtii TaxID=74700 RepID=A0A2K8NSE9_9MOLU|nr:dicarboxylate/amino acid:cation symporter [Entomoplasma freundtii]ATZ16078.1 proton/glutamate symporter [Entomoplasma freundtii]TDY57020.1 hypothetical protein JN01_0521 [Entomoplasma freundtii]